MNPDPSVCLIDFNYVQLKDKICINECSIYDFGRKVGQTFHITASKNIQYVIQHNKESQKQFTWTQKFFQNIPLDYGTVRFTGFIRYLEKNVIDTYDYVLVKGNAKQDMLNETFQKRINIFNLDHFSCPSFAKLRYLYNNVNQNNCIFHNSDCKYCTALKVNLINLWMVDNFQATFYHLRYKKDSEIAACELELPYL